MPSQYRSTQKNVRALALVVKYIDSAISRAEDDNALPETKEFLRDLRPQVITALEREEATRVAVEEVPEAAEEVVAEAEAQPAEA